MKPDMSRAGFCPCFGFPWVSVDTHSRLLRCLFIVCLLISVPAFALAKESPAPIPEDEITALEEEFKRGRGQASSDVAVRRVFKSAARKGQALLRETPEAPNRFAVLGIMFRAQKKLLALDNAEGNRESLFATCEELAKAPDESGTVPAGYRAEGSGARS
ncbi:MAG: hypothetical protein HN700_09655 [Verrucomicrobia bacterium]|nr:hypothetical protein [Verrucomicrobiota bacterium]